MSQPITLPKGTIVHLKGIPCKLLEDVQVESKTLENADFLSQALQNSDADISLKYFAGGMTPAHSVSKIRGDS